jgi:8-oxo-dGTP pyrophosphatase MutT (NUDIX family)
MTPLIQLLNDYGQRWPAELPTVQRFKAFVAENPQCFERDFPPGHVTGSAWVVNRAGTHVLLTHHKKLNRWLQLGGHADGDRDILAVALREVAEESGLQSVALCDQQIFDLDIHRIPARPEMAEHYHYDVRFAVATIGDERYVVSAESHDLNWIDITTINRVTDSESIRRMALKWQLLSHGLSPGAAAGDALESITPSPSHNSTPIQ